MPCEFTIETHTYYNVTVVFVYKLKSCNNYILIMKNPSLDSLQWFLFFFFCRRVESSERKQWSLFTFHEAGELFKMILLV